MENIPYLRAATAIILKKTRMETGLSQNQLADFSGLSRSFIAAVEAGRTGFSGDALFLIAEVLRIPPAELLHEIDQLRKQRPPLPVLEQGRPRKIRKPS